MIDYGGGNVGSLLAALQRRGADFALTSDADVVERADAAILPGDGAFGATLDALRERGLDGAIRAVIAAGRPFLGICVGMQVLFDSSDEYGGTVGLRILPGDVRRFTAAPRVPHMGWNDLVMERTHPFVDGLATGAWAYFLALVPRGSDRYARRVVRVRRALRGDRRARQRDGDAVPPGEEPHGRRPAPRQLPAHRRGVTRALTLYPAIDLRGGHAVRLERGDPARETRYDADPVARARAFVAAGARALHVVDLDGAFGTGENQSALRAICAAVGVPVQTGGGIRTASDVEARFAAGAHAVVIGTLLVEQPAAARAIAARWGERIVAGIDARGDVVATRGWLTRPRPRATSWCARWRRGACGASCTRRSRATGWAPATT